MATIVTRAGKAAPLSNTELDANFTNLNTDKAELLSPAFTGTPSTTTPARFDRSTRIATMAAVGAEQGSLAGQLALNVSQAIAAGNGGSEINASGTITLTLPVGAAVPAGAAFIINNSGAGIVTIVPTGSDVLKRIDAAAGNIVLGAGDATTIVFAGGTLFNARVFVAGINAVVSTAQASADSLRVEKTISLPTGTDLNNVVTSGFYRLLGSALNMPTPNSIDSQLIVSRGADTITQMLTRYGDTVTFVRSGTPTQVGGAGVYGPWRTVYSNNNILGTVSQAAGVPTGAIIERGSNANGDYVRFADGTQICFRNVDLPGTALNTSTAGSGSWAAVFVLAPLVTHSVQGEIGNGSASTIGLVIYNGTFVQPTASGVTISTFAYRSATDGSANVVRFSVTALGRWF